MAPGTRPPRGLGGRDAAHRGLEIRPVPSLAVVGLIEQLQQKRDFGAGLHIVPTEPMNDETSACVGNAVWVPRRVTVSAATAAAIPAAWRNGWPRAQPT